ncbi:Hypothetical_protein [Hexamita inflata]|uniref:Hypothetical_protein n=1 Tax=Hexamita inflata TaxID=28002 RepID=A0AA86N5P3_9EUKA|nr:Hypothetical protein HINF_LOCUS893 [Hexamita inflata]
MHNVSFIDVNLFKIVILETTKLQIEKQKKQNFSECNLSNQEVPTPDKLQFYNKILSVHSSHKQIKKIMNDNKSTNFRTSLAQKKNVISTMLNYQIQTLNKQVDMLIQIVRILSRFLSQIILNINIRNNSFGIENEELKMNV